MPGKVIHLPDEIHAQLKAYCEERGISMTGYICGLLSDSMAPAKEPVAPPPPIRNVVPVQKKAMDPIIEDSTEGPKPWEGPAFYQKPRKRTA